MLTRAERLFLAVALIVMVLAYQPAWRGGWLWDDDMHVTPASLQSPDGLKRIWTDVGATLQYYPLLHTAFWIEHRQWGDTPLGYHVVNITLHAVSAILIAVLLRRLAVPGAVLAAAIFALHPIQVETVAWISEQKNTLSTSLCLGAALLYLRFDDTRRRRHYLIAAGLFVLALLSKTVTGMLPFALAVVLWWRRGRLNARRDLFPLLPLAILGVAAGLVTSWWELEFNRTARPDIALTLLERLLLIGRAVTAQLWHLVWPANLSFSYTRWAIDATVWWQYVFPAAWTAALVMLWRVRHRTRAPLAALLIFGLLLAPTLGLFNLYTFRYALVADHYQYLASLGVMAFAAAGMHLTFERWRIADRPAGYLLSGALLALLAGMTWQQSHDYTDAETLYRQTLRRQPDSWFALGNLGALKVEKYPDDAIAYLTAAIALKPDLAEAHSNLCNALLRTGRPDAALASCRRALEIDPRLPGALSSAGDAFHRLNRLAEAERFFEDLLRRAPGHPRVLQNLGHTLLEQGRPAEALARYRDALAVMPDDATLHSAAGNALTKLGRLNDAVTEYRAAIAANAKVADWHNNLGVVLDQLGRITEAIREFDTALRLDPSLTDASFNLGNLLARQGNLVESAALFERVLAAEPNAADARNSLGEVLLARGQRAQAIVQFTEALRLDPGLAIARTNLLRATMGKR